MMTHDELRVFALGVADAVRQTSGDLNPNDDWTTAFFVQAGDDSRHIVAAPQFGDPTVQRRIAHDVGRLLIVLRAKAVALVCTSWYARGLPDQRLTAGQRPDRTEAVTITSLAADDGLVLIGHIGRRESEHPILSEWEEIPLDRVCTADAIGPVRMALKLVGAGS